jgi:molecular chaperone DnaJ
MADIDYYEILGIEAHATRADIRRSFRALAMRYHPDQNPDEPGAEERFKLITQAYKILVDPKKRSHYDRMREAARTQRERVARQNRRRHEARHSRPAGDTTERPEHRTRSETPPTQQRSRKPWWEEDRPAAQSHGESTVIEGEDLHVDMTINTELAKLGGRQPLAISRRSVCETCKGTGAKPGTTVRACPECDPKQPSPNCHFCAGRGRLLAAFCSTCGGEGKTRATKTLLVNVPPRSKPGHLLRVPGEGKPGADGGKPGDLVIHLKVKQASDYEQRDSAVYSEVHVTPSTAALGGMVRVKTVDGTADLVIPPGTRSGTIFRLEGKGPKIGEDARGDHFVTVKIIVP